MKSRATLGERGGEFGVAMAEACSGNACAQIKIAFPLSIKDVAAFAVGESEVKPCVGWNNVRIDALLDG